jgi:prophage regulatory protein
MDTPDAEKALGKKPRTFIRAKVVKAKTGLAESSMYYLIAEGRFPRPVKLSEHMAAWIEEEVDNWMDDKVAAREAAQKAEAA